MGATRCCDGASRVVLSSTPANYTALVPHCKGLLQAVVFRLSSVCRFGEDYACRARLLLGSCFMPRRGIREPLPAAAPRRAPRTVRASRAALPPCVARGRAGRRAGGRGGWG